jgi:phosphoribosylanthranilate isomerase
VSLRSERDVERAAAFPAAALLADSRTADQHGGTGLVSNWDLAAALAQRRRLVLAGGIGAHNLAAAVNRVRPFAVDASSSLESAPGHKDPARVRAFLAAARDLD